jgi:Raf kinase inhibitor-like YbhB/YbcL family protein
VSFAIRSPHFEADGEIPRKFTCEGQNLSPALEWKGAPAGTSSLALIVDDPDVPDPAAPKRVWVHWVVYNLPASAARLADGGALPAGTREGLNDSGRLGYGGPCPPVGRHRYFFTLYALDAPLPELGTPTRAELEQAMAGHIIGQAQVVGTYQRSGH